jgi:hypothetical protein
VKLELAIRAVHGSESTLAEELLELGERHKTEHDVFHLTRTLAEWAQGHARALAQASRRRGFELKADEPGQDDTGGPLSRIREKTAELIGRRPEPGILLLRDLRQLHLSAAAASIDWTLLGQGAQAARDSELLALVSACHPQTLRTLRWTTTKLKTAAPQILTT